MMTVQYQECKKKGDAYQEFVIDKLNQQMGWGIKNYHTRYEQVYYGENAAGMEIKFDDKIEMWGRLYFESHEKSDPSNKNWIQSGILRNDNTWLWLQGNYKKTYFLSKFQIVWELFPDPKWQKKTTPTSQGFVVDLQYLQKNNYIIHTMSH